MAFVRTALLIAALVLSWVALRAEGSAHVAAPVKVQTMPPAQAAP